jgi:hypothetical protein
MDEECCICFNPTTNLIDPCGHLMCKECILTWCRKTISCPLCKTTLLAPCSMSDLEPVKSPTVFFGVAPSQQVGVTISNISDASQRGVRVKNMVKDGLAMVHGMKKGHIITHINDIPVRAHGDAVAIINQAQCYGHPLRFTMVDPDPPKQKAASPRAKTFVDSIMACFRIPVTRMRSSSPTSPQ